MATGFDVSKQKQTTIARQEVRTTSILVSREELRSNSLPNPGDSNRAQYENESDANMSRVERVQSGDTKQMVDKINELTARNERQQKLLEEKDKEIATLSSNMDAIENKTNRSPTKRNSELMSKSLIEIGQLLAQEGDYVGCDEMFSTTRNSGLTKLKDSSLLGPGQVEVAELNADAFEEIVIAMRSLLARRRLEIEHLKGKLSTSNEQQIAAPRSDKQMEKCRKEIMALKAEIAALRTDNESAEKTRDVMTEKIIQLENIRNDLENDLWLLKSSRNEPKTTTTTADTDNGVDRAHSSTMHAFQYKEPVEIQRSTFLDQVENALKEQIDALNEENDKLHQITSDFRRSREVLEDELEDMRSKERNYKWEMEQKGHEMLQLQSQLEFYRNEIIDLKEELAGLRADKEYADKSRDERKTNIAQLEKMRNDLEYELSQVKTAEIGLQSSLNREQQRNEQLIAERDLLKQDSVAFSAKCTQLMSEKVTLESQLERAQDDMQTLRNAFDDCLKAKNALETRSKLYEQRETKLKQDYEDGRQEMEKQLFKLNSEFIELNRKLNEVGNEAEQLNKDKNEYKALCQQIKREKSNCDQQIKELMNRINSDNDENKHLQQQLAAVRAKKSELEKQNELVERFNRELQTEIELVRKEATKYKTDLEEMRKDKVALANKANEMQRQFEAKLQKERLLRSKECDHLKHEFEMEKVAFDMRNEELVNQLKVEKERQIAELQEELSKVKLKMDSNEQQYNEKLTQLEREKLNFEIQSQKEKNALNAILSEKEAKLNHKLSEIEHASQKLNEMDASNNKLQAKVSELENARRQENKTYQQTVDSLNGQLNELKSEKSSFEQEKSSLSLQLQREQEERLNLAKIAKQSEDQMKELAANYDKLKQSNAQICAQRDAIEKEIRVKDEQLNSLASLLNAKQDECKQQQQSIENYDKKMTEEENLKQDLIKDINELRSSLMDIEKSRLELKKQLSNNAVLQQSLENELNAKVAIIREMNVIIEKKVEKEEQKQEELNKLKNSLVEFDNEKQALMSELVNLRHKLNDCEHLLNLEKSVAGKRDQEVQRLTNENGQLQATISQFEEELRKLKNLKQNEQKILNLEAKLAKLLKEKRNMDDALSKINSAIRNCLKLNPVLTTINADNVYSNLIDLISKLNTISEEKESLQLQQQSFENFLRTVKESNTSLTLRNESLEDELRRIRKEMSLSTKEMEDMKSKLLKQEEVLEKLRLEKKHQCERMANLSAQMEVIEREKEKVIRDVEIKRSLYKREQITESRYLIDNRVKILESTKKSLESRITEIIKQLSDVSIEKDSLRQEIDILNKTVRELQASNLKLHSALSDANIALKKSCEEEQELKRRMVNMSESIEDHDRVSRDVVLQLRTLKYKIDELTTERTFLQQSLDANRESFVSLSNTNRRLKHRIEQLDAELNLTVSKMRSNESQLNAKSTALMEKEAQIKKLQQELMKMDDSNKVSDVSEVARK